MTTLEDIIKFYQCSFGVMRRDIYLSGSEGILGKARITKLQSQEEKELELNVTILSSNNEYCQKKNMLDGVISQFH
jgi:hypothetical protein